MADLDTAIRARLEALADWDDLTLMHAALIAVLNLHSDDEVGFCRECSDEFPAASPCPTVHAVAKGLGVEAGHG